jgi:hypothetical protein
MSRYSLVAQFADGSLTLDEIANATGCSPQQARDAIKAARRSGIDARIKRAPTNAVYGGAVTLRSQVLRLADGTRTIPEIARALGVLEGRVVSTINAARADCRVPVPVKAAAARYRDRSLQQVVDNLPPDIARWLRNSVPPGATLADAVRAIITDAYLDEQEAAP